MSAAAAIPAVSAPAAEQKKARTITFERFKKTYSSREDQWKYEWSDGSVEKTLRTMDQSQNKIYRKLQSILLAIFKTEHPGMLLLECESFFGGEHYRRPDISYFTNAQLDLFGIAPQVPNFVIEVISNSDQSVKVQRKMIEYRKAKVAVVWQVFPFLKEVHIYHGEKMEICFGEKIISAAPVLPELELAAASLFE